MATPLAQVQAAWARMWEDRCSSSFTRASFLVNYRPPSLVHKRKEYRDAMRITGELSVSNKIYLSRKTSKTRTYRLPLEVHPPVTNHERVTSEYDCTWR